MRIALLLLATLALAPIAAAGPCGDCYAATMRYVGGVNADANQYSGETYRSSVNVTSIAYAGVFGLHACQGSVGCVQLRTGAMVTSELAETNRMIAQSFDFSDGVLVRTFALGNELLG